MALNGSFYGKTSNTKIKPKIEWYVEQNVLGNYSDITATLSYSRTNKGYTTEGTWSGELIIDDQVFTGRKRIEVTYNSDTVAITAQARVIHDNYGSKTLVISATGGISGTTLTSTNISADITLDTIPRASTISASNADIGSCSTVVVNRKNDAFTHSIAYSFGGLSGYIDAEGHITEQLIQLTATTINMLLPDSFYGQIPNSPSDMCTLTCITWSGTDQIGEEQIAQFKATAAEDLCAPTAEVSVVDVNDNTVALTGDPNVLVRFLSVARCTILAEPRNGASIAEIRIAGNEVDGATLDIPDVDTDRVVFQVTDSRGYTINKEVELDLIPYVMLTNNASVQRTDPTSGNAVLTLQGNCWKGDFGTADNSLAAEYQIGGDDPVPLALSIQADDTYLLRVDLTGLDYQKSHTVRVTVQDFLNEVQKPLTVNKGIPVFHWGEDNFQFTVPVTLPGLTINGQSLEEYIRSIVQGG